MGGLASLASRRVGRSLLIAAALAAVGSSVSPAAAENRQKQVLVLYAPRRDAQIVVVGDRELQQILGSGVPGGVDYYSEAIDQSRFLHPDYEAALRDSLRLKYQLQRFDVVIAIGSSPLAFVDRNRDALFGGTPIVFYAENPPVRRLRDSTGLIVPLNLRGSLDLAAELQPDLEQVFVIIGVGGTFDAEARAQLLPRGRFGVTFLSGLRTQDLEARLAALPAHSAVYYITVDRDGADQNFRPLDYLDRVTAVANAPVYSWVDSAMGHGVVGGSLKEQAAEMRAVGALALRILRGEGAADIPVSSPDLNLKVVDWRQIRRWDIGERRVPAGTVIRFREPTAWDRYKGYILAAVLVLSAQTALIAALLVQRARRRRAEEQVRSGEAALRASYERIRDLGARLLEAQERERARIARELHDDISQQMALMQIDLEQMKRVSPAPTEAAIQDVLDRAHTISRSMHDLSHRLHPAKLQLIGLQAALESLRQELSMSGLAIAFTHENIPSTLPRDLTLCLFRIVQEALQNAIKHSGARNASVHLAGGDRLTLTIVDDGEGFDVNRAWGKGLGLISMQERVETIGGTFQIRSSADNGTWLEIAVPLRAAHDAGSVAV